MQWFTFHSFYKLFIHILFSFSQNSIKIPNIEKEILFERSYPWLKNLVNYDNFSDDLEDEPPARNYVSLAKEASEKAVEKAGVVAGTVVRKVGDAVGTLSDKLSDAEEHFTTLSQTISDAEEKAEKNVEEFFDEDEAAEEDSIEEEVSAPEASKEEQ